MTDERFEFTSGAKKKIALLAVTGIVLTVLGILLVIFGGHGDHDTHAAEGHGVGHHSEASHSTGAHGTDKGHGEDAGQHGAEGHGEVTHAEGEHGGAHHAEFHWWDRVYANLWINNIFFVGLSIIGFFFVALQYVAQAGWSASIKRVAEPFGYWLPIGGVLMIITFLVANHTLFHWTHTYLYEVGSATYDKIIAGKAGFFFWPLQEEPSFPVFWFFRLILYFVIWYAFFRIIRKYSLQEDLHGGTEYWWKMRKYSAIFIVIFAVTSSTSAWDWVMSLDPHWFSTMFGWYVFASWFVAGLAAITLLVVLLKEQGYLKIVNQNHLHDLGKFVFAFSIFWTYIWFSQFLLIYYANIPEETVYFVERLSKDQYSPIFFINLILNFFFPFLVLMTRDSKRHTIFLKIVCTVVLIGHWMDFYLMVTPGVLKENGGFHFLEIGIALIYLSAFIFVVLRNLAKAPLIAKNHPMLQESIHHHI